MSLRFPLHTLIVAACLTIPSMAAPLAGAQSTAGKAIPPAQVFDKLLSGQEKEIVGLAEAMPADKFDFAPSDKIGLYDGVSNFSSQIKHLANANYGFYRSFGVAGAKTHADFDKITTRDQILSVLKESYTYDHAAIATMTPENAFIALDDKGTTRAGIVAASLQHNNDHYGQLVEYLRMNGIIPPASRK